MGAKLITGAWLLTMNAVGQSKNGSHEDLVEAKETRGETEILNVLSEISKRVSQ